MELFEPDVEIRIHDLNILSLGYSQLRKYLGYFSTAHVIESLRESGVHVLRII